MPDRTIPEWARHIADRGSPSVGSVRGLLAEAGDLKELLDDILEGLDNLDDAADDYEAANPSEGTREEREEAAAERATAWEQIQESAGDLADHLDSLRGYL